MNNTYSFPRMNVSDSESDEGSTRSESTDSMKGVTYYDLVNQNEKRVLDETDQLVELVWEIREMEKEELYFHFGYDFHFCYRTLIFSIEISVLL